MLGNTLIKDYVEALKTGEAVLRVRIFVLSALVFVVRVRLRVVVHGEDLECVIQFCLLAERVVVLEQVRFERWQRIHG